MTGVPLASAVYEGGGCRLLLDRRHLLDALDAGFRNFLFADAASPILSHDGIGGMHILMPMLNEGDNAAKEPGSLVSVQRSTQSWALKPRALSAATLLARIK